MMHESRNKRLSGCNLIVLSALIFLFPSLGFGPLELDEQQLSLAGVGEIQVVVKIGLSREGPTRQSLQEEVEKELVEGGMHIVKNVDEDEEINPHSVRTEDADSLPVLYVEVAVWKNGENPYVYFVTANFYQIVHLARNSNIKTHAATWSASVIGEGTIGRIRDDVARMAKKFAGQHKLNNTIEK